MEILYEDKNMIAINKPPGIIVHHDKNVRQGTVSDWFVMEYPEALNVGEPLVLQDETTIKRPGIVHRLDKDTSGVMLLAKTEEGFENLKSQFKNREVEKTYHTFAYGNLKEDKVKINDAIGRSKGDIRMWAVEKFARGKIREAETDVKVLGRTESEGEHLVFLEAKPKTGRTHQIRVHLKSISHPVICDSLYAPKRPCPLGFDRLALHAREIIFKNLKGEEVTITAPYPDDFIEALSKFSL